MILNYLLAFLIVTLTASADSGYKNIRLTCKKFGEVFLKGKHRLPEFSYSLCKAKADKFRRKNTIYHRQHQLLKGHVFLADILETSSGSLVGIGTPHFSVEESAKECTSDKVTLEVNIWKRTFKKRDISATPWSGNEEKSVRLVATVVPGIEHKSNIPYFDTPLGSVQRTSFLSQNTVKHSHLSFTLNHSKQEDETPIASIERSVSIIKNYAKILFHTESVKTDELSEYLYQKISELPSDPRPYLLEEAGLEVQVNAWCVTDWIQIDKNKNS